MLPHTRRGLVYIVLLSAIAGLLMFHILDTRRAQRAMAKEKRLE